MTRGSTLRSVYPHHTPDMSAPNQPTSNQPPTSPTTPNPNQPPSNLLDRLAEIVGPANVLTDPSVTAGYATDWTGRFVGATPLVVRPADTAQVAAALAVLTAAAVYVVPQGGNTGLVGGSVPLDGEAVMSLTRLQTCGPVDVLSAQATFGAGVTLADAQAHAAAAGFTVGIDLAARDSATIGGMVSTNAGGINVVRYGAMRSQITGIEAVLADGTVLSHMAGLTKDNTGYDLASLFTGSEGTLGIVTAVRLQLRPKPTNIVTALIAVSSVEAGVPVAAELCHGLDSLYALEAVFAGAMRVVCDHLGVQPPVGTKLLNAQNAAGTGTEGTDSDTGDAPMWLLVEVASRTMSTEALADELASTIDKLSGTQLDGLSGTQLDGLSDTQLDGPTKPPNENIIHANENIIDVAVGLDSTSRRQLWSFREQISEAINTLGTPHKLDVTLPASRLVEFVNGVPAVVRAVDADARTILFGHLGDGNVHVNVLPREISGEVIDEAVLTYVASLGGSISAEHGIGTAKKKYLHLNRSPAELAAFTALKRSLDPRGILNPNVLLTD